MNIFTQFLKRGVRDPEKQKQEILSALMRREANLNKSIFGPIPKGVKRDFFCLDKHTWIWYEEWTDENGKAQKITTRYVVRPTEILKSQNGGAYYRLTIAEAKNFQKATAKYVKKSKTELYADRQKPVKA